MYLHKVFTLKHGGMCVYILQKCTGVSNINYFNSILKNIVKV